MTGKLIFVPDTHVVVPKEPTDKMIDAARNTPIVLTGYDDDDAPEDYKAVYKSTIAAAPQLTTPPVLRWEGGELMFGNWCIAYLLRIKGKWKFERGIFLQYVDYDTEQEARRAAEKSLGLPIVEEV